MTLSAMPLGLQCAPWKCKFVLLNWCGCEGLLGGISRFGGRPLMSRTFRVAQRRSEPAFVGAYVEAHAADVAIGVSASQAGAKHAVRRAADLGLDERLVHGRHNRQVRHAEFGHMGVRLVGLPQRSTLPQRQRAERQARLQHAPPRGTRSKPLARAEEPLLFGHDPASS
jgi:hypothetical protein